MAWSSRRGGIACPRTVRSVNCTCVREPTRICRSCFEGFESQSGGKHVALSPSICRGAPTPQTRSTPESDSDCVNNDEEDPPGLEVVDVFTYNLANDNDEIAKPGVLASDQYDYGDEDDVDDGNNGNDDDDVDDYSEVGSDDKEDIMSEDESVVVQEDQDCNANPKAESNF